MRIQEFFEKDIARPIETVIKADDTAHLKQEVEEYVITKQIKESISPLFEAYTSPLDEGINGVWISGFFGSGKSHLLKILAYTLGGYEFEGQKIGLLLAEKIKNEEVMLFGAMQKAVVLPSASILFNIDQHAQYAKDAAINPVLRVFYKVFYDYQGFYGAHLPLAQMESWLTQNGKYETFQKIFEEQTRAPWKEKRKDFSFLKKKIADCYAAAMQEPFNEKIIDDLSREITISVEDFVARVKEYLKSQPSQFRLNFFIDEVGQFIGGDIQKMLTLQTVTEALAVQCPRQAWVFVTSQEAIDDILSSTGEFRANDFSKIQSRFRIKINLTSANVDEVLEERLLKKTQSGPLQQQMRDFYEKNARTLSLYYDFSEDSGVRFYFYRNAEEYIRKFPFVPYQFDLFQQCIMALSRRSAFMGRYQSVGERSMLGVFQETLKTLAKEEKNWSFDEFVGFDLFLDGIRSIIKSELQASLHLAESQLINQSLPNPLLAIRILKVLFLIKYYGNFKATLQNIAVLLNQKILDRDWDAYKKEIQTCLNILERQTYIQRSGQTYEFLSDIEKDYEEQIKNADYPAGKVSEFYAFLIFENALAPVLKNKLRIENSRAEFSYYKKIDDRSFGREEEICLQIITPHHPKYEQPELIRQESMGAPNRLYIRLAQDLQFLPDFKRYLQAESFLSQKLQTPDLNPNHKSVLERRKDQNNLFKQELIDRVKKMVKEADLYHDGAALSYPGLEIAPQYDKAIQTLLKKAYHKYALIEANSHEYTSQKIDKLLLTPKDKLFDQPLSPPAQEVLDYLQRLERRGEETTVAKLRDHFSKPPYGWEPIVVFCLLAELFAHGNLEARQGASHLDAKQFKDALNDRANYSRLIIKPQLEISSEEARLYKALYKTLFQTEISGTKIPELANAFRQKFDQTIKQITQWNNRNNRPPFLAALDSLNELLIKIKNLPDSQLLKEVSQAEEQIKNGITQTYELIQEFFQSQMELYQELYEFSHKDTTNLEEVGKNELAQIIDILNDRAIYQNNRLREAKRLKEELARRVLERLTEERKRIVLKVEEYLSLIASEPDFDTASLEIKDQILNDFEIFKKEIQDIRYLPKLQLREKQLAERYSSALELLHTPKFEPSPSPGDFAQDTINSEGAVNSAPLPSKPVKETIKLREVRFLPPQRKISTQEELETYLNAYRKALLEILNQNKDILIDF